jgi:hypothetical protein
MRSKLRHEFIEAHRPGYVPAYFRQARAIGEQEEEDV